MDKAGTKLCPKCGKAISENVRFCRHCGAPIPRDQTLFFTSVSSVARRWSKTKIVAITILIALSAMAVLLVLVNFAYLDALEQFLGVGVVEELFKLSGLIFIALKAPYFLKTKKGTLTIAILSALIFTVIEDVYYITALGATVFDRLPFFPAHMLWTGIAAYGVSIAVIHARTEPEMKKNFLKAYLTEGPIALLAIAVLLHAAFDFFIFDIITTVAVFALSTVIFIQAYRHFPEKLITYRYLGAKSMLRSLIGLSPR